MDLWIKIALAVVLGIIVVRLWPTAGHMLKHGPKGTADDWRSAIIPIALVIGFIGLLIMLLRA